MDPNALSHLDPKLRETYERVMGASKPSDPPSTPFPAPIDGPGRDSATLPDINAQENDLEPLTQTVNISQPLESINQIKNAGETHGHKGLMQIFYILGTSVFFIVYVFFWLKIFNIPLPF